MVGRTIGVALMAVALLGCQSTKPMVGSAQLVVGTPGSEKRYNLGEVAASNCRLELDGKEVRLTNVDCLILLQLLSREAGLKSDAKRQRKTLAGLQASQAKLGAIAVDAAIVSSGAANMVDAIRTNDAETQKLLDQIAADYAKLNSETQTFLAALIEQYKALNERIDKSIPNYQQ